MYSKKIVRPVFFLGILFFFWGVQKGYSQDKPNEADHSYQPLTLKLDDSGHKYIRFITWHQIWVTTNNLDVDDSKLQLSTSIRRSRFLAYAQVSPKFLILTHFGLNSLSVNNLTPLGNNGDAPQLFLHGAWTEFKLSDELYLGGGLHYWNGLTRLSSQSTLNFMTLDQSRPFVHWQALGITDQFARHLGIYAKGEFGKLDYRLALNNPSRSPLGNGVSFGEKSTTLTYNGASNLEKSSGDPSGNSIFEGYLRYNFWDAESTKLPYNVGAYLGKKKILSVGAGFFVHPNGMFDTETQEHSGVSHLAVDAFLDMPVTGGSVTAYASFINFDYGNNYVSRWGGTGQNIYAHIGCFFKETKLMPYVGWQTGNYEGLNDRTSSLNLGLNYFILGHNAKLSLEYHQISNDPREGGLNDIRQLRLQGHIFL